MEHLKINWVNKQEKDPLKKLPNIFFKNNILIEVHKRVIDVQGKV